MGNCGGQGTKITEAEMNLSKEIDAQLTQNRKLTSREIKLLLLGPGESGKSTFLRQVKIIHLKGFTPEERRTFSMVIYSNIILGMKSTVERIYEEQKADRLSPESKAISTVLLPDDLPEDLTPEISSAIKVLWQDPFIKSEMKKDCSVSESVGYFYEEIDRISDPNYIPTDKDMLHSRVRTSGIVEICFQIGNSPFRLVDVGGQRSERKKWIHCFEDTTAIIFVTSLNDYDLVLREDEETNRMEEAMVLFDEICNSPWFDRSSIILFLNKRDLFEAKLADESNPDLTHCFPEYTGGRDIEKGIEFIQEKFVGLNRAPNKRVYSHVTCATDTEQIRTVMRAVNDTIMMASMSNF
eukprot:TRINITY_DN9811_c0_g1_i1.p1 TRINITY_DN9811_c0_g1~~TRINITY_DN9811_c0_g1_i1.p1  ORF type:complete len:353 (+),score=141.88 TRINITY_DN9811_c0_g1_i1:46-1104(+)